MSIPDRVCSASSAWSRPDRLLVGLTGGALLGLVGVLMAVPVAAADKVVYDDHRDRAHLLDVDDQPDDEKTPPDSLVRRATDRAAATTRSRRTTAGE
ncbi:hypothetical protein Lfu02_68150 [Longispora fulva]|uniref:Uncharacterized protein n=1 Tax=Longispora fulva TaxID=619741 RepID=A0A8J7GGS7_9ACTN|nr:hypothetical protein [Longispora fulva]MBG6134069.1 hypothetical protein [Longispora fulva]GIG62443.1 hypothetical protein Lfu02_68150 [Longispora fulva]